jgi:hypothetical protein
MSCSGKDGEGKSPTSLPGIKLIHQVHSTCRYSSKYIAAADTLDHHCNAKFCHCAVQQDTRNSVVQMSVLPSFVAYQHPILFTLFLLQAGLEII